MNDVAKTYEREIKEIAELITKSNHLVFFTGAGVSTESGLSDYRGPDGVWTRRDKGLKPKLGKGLGVAEPNIAHNSITELQSLGLLKYLISQNVDNLHLRSGIHPDRIAELHGNHAIMKCIQCDTRYSKEKIGWSDQKFGRGYRTQKPVSGQPNCPLCTGRIISSVVNFEDPMPEKELELAIKHSRKADVFIVVGSTLLVQPAASMPRETLLNNGVLIIINLGDTPSDKDAHYRISAKAGEILPLIVTKVKENLNVK
ncbi:MAG: SIR2 family NAD-dependent protein deacylase [Candidatus Hodarchaeales archaeon]|jgi:mono-ADP-ribosyltransferase sirtuin 6